MKFAICDDEPMHCAELENVFSRRNIDSEVYQSGEELLADLEKNQRHYDAFFIDMEMGGMNGLETAKHIHTRDERALIVFVTSHEHYAIESFECEPLRFLVKPVQEAKLQEAIQAIQRKLTQKRATLEFTFNKEYIRLYCDDILYCESKGNQINIVTKNASYTTRLSMTELQAKLNAEMFVRVHRGFVINIQHLKTVKGDKIQLHDCAQIIPLGRSYKKEFNKAVISYEERSFGKC